MKRFLRSALITLSMLAMVPVATGQYRPDDGRSGKDTQEKRIEIQVYFMGHFNVPEGFKAYKTKTWIDAWFGYIVSPDGEFRINYSAGMVETPFQNGESEYLWVRNERRGKVTLKYGLRRKGQEEEIAAQVPGMNFYAAIKNERDLDLFLEIVRSYQIGRCSNCEQPGPEPAIQHALGADSP